MHELFELVEDPVSLETPVGAAGDSMYGDMLEDEHSEQPDAALAELLRGVELRKRSPRSASGCATCSSSASS